MTEPLFKIDAIFHIRDRGSVIVANILSRDFVMKGFIGSSLELRCSDGTSLKCKVTGIPFNNPGKPDRLDFFMNETLDNKYIVAEVFLVD
jgi:hypothetical protein